MSPSQETTDYDKLCEELEKQELDAPNGVPPVHIYQQLLAIYLLQNDLTGAKFLWQRIPSNSKSSSAELSRIWQVGKNLWQRDFQGVYSALSQEWSPSIKPIMETLEGKLHTRAKDLVSLAYSSIGLDDYAQFLNASSEVALAKAKELGWGYDASTRMVLPLMVDSSTKQSLTSEEQLQKLADYVSFLEN